jgi:hypothetical protein
LHPNESLGGRKVNAKNKRKVEYEETNWCVYPCGFGDESTDSLLNVRDGTKEEKTLKV